jgi:transforming growth factor-beta-induced protein
MATEGAEFGQLVAALTAVSTNTDIDLIAALKGDGPFTVFAPTDAAFQTLYDAIGDANADMSVDINDLVEAAGLETIATVLQYHVYSGAVFSTDIPNVLGTETSVTLSPLAGGTWMLNSNLTITPTDAVLSIGLDDAAIVATDVMTTNGVIHAINQVILP